MITGPVLLFSAAYVISQIICFACLLSQANSYNIPASNYNEKWYYINSNKNFGALMVQASFIQIMLNNGNKSASQVSM